MDDMSGLLAQNFGIRGQGKSAPMAASKTASTHRSVPSSSYDDIFNSTSSSVNNNSNRGSSTVNQTAHDPILDTFNKGPVFDTPAYDDDDIFNGVPGIRSSSTSSFKYDDVFASDRSPPPYDDLLGSIGKGRQSPPAYDDLLGGLGMGKRMDHGSAEIKGQGFTTGFEDLLPGFGSSTPMSQPEREAPHETAKTAATPSAENDPFFVVETGTSTGGSFSDPLDNLTKPSEAVKVDASSPTHSFFSENPPNSSDSMPSFSAATGGDFTQSERCVETEAGSDPFGGTTKYTTTYGGEGNDASKYEQSPESSEHSESGDDIWLTVSEIPLFTKPTSAPPPSRPAPPLSSSSSSPEQDEYGGEMERSSAAMKDAMNKAELKFKHAKEVREKMAANERDNKAELEMQERLRREEEQRRVERERGRARQAVERATREARERAANEAMLRAQRGAVQRAQQEARERAAQEAKEKAAAAEVAREREREKAAAAAERAAAAAAAERAAKEREAKERERRMQRAAVEKAAAEARERLAQAAKEKHQQQQTQQRPPAAAAAAAAHQQQTQQRPPAAATTAAAQQNDDFDSIFGMGASGGSRSSSVPKKNPQEPQAQNRTPSASAATVRKTAAAANMMDDLSAIFGGGGPSSSGEFQEIQGETEDRRKARFEREMRTRDRAAKALAEKNARDMQVQQEQAERHRIGETLDFEIKRWAAGKEGNLRSLLSSLHYILWAGCGWQPVSMADLITGASVKKVYRKATLCIHPDKVQQKGATLQQKYIAEKVFDILKEAWNKFNSEELF